MTAEIIAQMTTAIVSIVGAVTTSIMSVRSHGQTTQAIIAANQPTTANPILSQPVRSVPPQKPGGAA
jgi:hypothetical protein